MLPVLVSGLVSPVKVSTNRSKWGNLCNNLIDELQVGESHRNGKINEEGRNFPVPALHREGMEEKGKPVETQGTSCAGRAAGGSATPPLLLFTAGLGHRNMGQGCAGTCSQAALCHSSAKLSRLTLTEGSDSAVTSGRVGGELAMGFAPMGARAECALHSLSPNNSDQASLAVSWLITLY